MFSTKLPDFDGFESLHTEDLDEERLAAPRAFGLAAVCVLVLGAIAAAAALVVAAVLAAPVLLGLIVLHI